jgi:hypothetical protein
VQLVLHLAVQIKIILTVNLGQPVIDTNWFSNQTAILFFTVLLEQLFGLLERMALGLTGFPFKQMEISFCTTDQSPFGQVTHPEIQEVGLWFKMMAMWLFIEQVANQFSTLELLVGGDRRYQLQVHGDIIILVYGLCHGRVSPHRDLELHQYQNNARAVENPN